jgi:type VI secretion system protein ImpH
MATKSRQQSSTLEYLFNSPELFDFFQAVRLLKRLYHYQHSENFHSFEATRDIATRNDLIKFHLKTSNKFSVGYIEKIQINEMSREIEVFVNFMGLTGVTGILPQHYTELLMNAESCGNLALRDFFDIFNHRIISLFYAAWEKNHIFTSFERISHQSNSVDPISQTLYSLSGMGIENIRNTLSIQAQCFAFYAGIFSRQPRSATALESLLQDHFKLPIKVLQFQGQWLQLADDERSLISSQRSRNNYQQLGRNFVLGKQYWSTQNKFRLYIGPLKYEQFQHLLPNEKKLKPIIELTRIFCGIEFDFDIQIELLADDVPYCVIGRFLPAYLGWNSWLRSRSSTKNANDMIINTNLINQLTEVST